MSKFMSKESTNKKAEERKALQREQDVLDVLKKYNRTLVDAERIVGHIFEKYTTSPWDIYDTTPIIGRIRNQIKDVLQTLVGKDEIEKTLYFDAEMERSLTGYRLKQ